jgi:hypothetical protein
MRTLALVLALAVTAIGSVAGAAPRPGSERGVTIASASDASPGRLDPRTRKRHAEIVRQTLLDVLRRSGTDVRLAGIGPRQIDVAVMSWRVTPRVRGTEVSVQLRIVVCDGHGKILSMLTGRATMSGAPGQVAQLREQVLAEAVLGMTTPLTSQLARAVS